MSNATHFAPSERLEADRIDVQHALFASFENGEVPDGGVTDLTIVVNTHRQIVYASNSFLGLIDMPEADARGHRPGEIIGCIHAVDMPGGCGTSAACKYCGAVNALLEAQSTGARVVRDCTIETSGSGRRRYLHFRVTSTPFELERESFVLLTFADTYESKRRTALERVFFHDIMNSVSGLHMHIDLLRREIRDQEAGPLADRIAAMIRSLEEEIRSQKQLVYAENGELTLQRNLIVSTEFLDDIVGDFRSRDLARRKGLVVDKKSRRFALVADEALVRRIVSNMIKNALEATGAGDIVETGCCAENGIGEFWVRNPGVIPPDVRARIFRPFFSTKGSNRGLGTYSMKLLAEGYLNGRVWYETDEKRGTIFHVAIPLGRLDDSQSEPDFQGSDATSEAAAGTS